MEMRERALMARRTAILLVAFGTTVDEGRKAYETFGKAVEARHPSSVVRWAFSSGRVRAALLKRGVRTLSMEEALNALAEDGASEIAIQSLHIFPGEEFDGVVCGVSKFKDSKAGANVRTSVGRPLLFSATDLERFVAGLPELATKGRASDAAVILFGHGNRNGVGDLVYIAANFAFNKADRLAFVTTAEGRPDFRETVEELKGSGTEKAFLVPMLFVAGDHARNDMAGDSDDSLSSLLKKEEIEPVPVLRGLGETKCATAIFLDHLDDALKSLKEGDAK
jgi:sirohydrochlorin cobaltochelatase